MRIAVLASGGGSNFEAIAQAIRSGRLSSEIVLCLSDRESAGVLERAKKHGVPTAVVTKKRGSDHGFAERILAELDRAGADFIALAGYLKMVPEEVVSDFRNRIVNIHPSLLPAFGGPGMYGRHVHAAVLAHGAKVSGATVHLVDAEYDTGPIVAQRCVEVRATDSPETLGARTLKVEHELYPHALRLFEEDRVRIQGRVVQIISRKNLMDPK